jgi:hypothetical protein
MAGIEDVFKGNIMTGLAVGVGVAVLAPVIAPIVSNVGKPLAKSLIKSGMLLYDRGRETLAELGEVFEDLVAEAKVEMEAAQSATTAGVAMTTPPAPATETPPQPDAP